MADANSAEARASGAAPGVADDPSLLWAAFAGRLRAFVARRVPAGIEPDDVVQEVFVRVVRHLPSLRDAERMEAWLFQIARNTLRDAVRVRQRRDLRTDALEVDVGGDAEFEHALAAEADLAPCLTPMVARLAEPYRSAIELTSFQGLTQAGAAKRAGVSVSGMKSRVQRARDQLKAMLLRCCEIHLDARRGVADYHLRESAACDTPSRTSGDDAAAAPLAALAATRINTCVHPERAASSSVSGEEWLPAIYQETHLEDTNKAPDPSSTDVPTALHQATSTCCGGPAPVHADACCARDAEVKSIGGSGCGCGSAPSPSAAKKTRCCG